MTEDDDSTCIDRDGDWWPEHDYDETDCRRCGAEPDHEDVK